MLEVLTEPMCGQLAPALAMAARPPLADDGKKPDSTHSTHSADSSTDFREGLRESENAKRERN